MPFRLKRSRKLSTSRLLTCACARHPLASRFEESRSQKAEHTVVIVNSGDVKIGLVVDHLLGEEEIVVKSLAENFVNIRGLAGASLMGDGRVSLILDVSALLGLAAELGGRVSA